MWIKLVLGFIGNIVGKKVGKKTALVVTTLLGLALTYFYIQGIKKDSYELGRQDLREEIRLEYDKKLEASVSSLEEEYGKAILTFQEKAKIASNTIQELSELPKTVEVEKIIEITKDSDCKFIDVRFIGLLNSQYKEWSS